MWISVQNTTVTQSDTFGNESQFDWYVFPSTVDERPRSVCRQWWRDGSTSWDAPTWPAPDELPGVTCSSASSVPVSTGLLVSSV